MKASKPHAIQSEPDPENEAAGARTADQGLIAVADLRADDDNATCLRPLGLCELGGSCDSCWYRPDHPRFKNPI
jgi:hypothetical protein